jgi:hypothetical protein
MKLIIDEISMETEVSDNQDYDDYEPEPWRPEEGLELKARMDERRARFDRGEWWLIGVRATAQLHWAEDEGHYSISGPRIKTPGIWGIESDADGYLDEVYHEELSILRDMLKAMGFSDDDIDEHLTKEEIRTS